MTAVLIDKTLVSDADLNEALAAIIGPWWSESSANYIRKGKLSVADIKAKYVLRDLFAKHIAEHTRADLSNALIAAAFEAAGEVAAVFVHERLYKAKFPACSYHHADIKAAVKALTPANAQAALHAMIDDAVKAALQAKELNHVES